MSEPKCLYVQILVSFYGDFRDGEVIRGVPNAEFWLDGDLQYVTCDRKVKVDDYTVHDYYFYGEELRVLENQRSCEILYG